MTHKLKEFEDLVFCTVCKCTEGDLTTECCGHPIFTDGVRQLISKTKLDFVNGHWTAPKEK